MSDALIELLQIAFLLALAPVLVGWLRMVKCWMQGRTSASLMQPYRDLRKLFAKDVVMAENASWIFRSAPYIIFGTVVLAGGVVPILSLDLPLALTADAIVLVMMFAFARFFTALAGMDIGTAFGGMGSSRELMVSSLAEPAMLMVIFTMSLICRSTSLTTIAAVVDGAGIAIKPSIAFAFIAFVIIVLAENGRVPVDNPTTHLELTMLHEAMILEYSGRHLALIEWAGMMKLMLFLSLGNIFFLPYGIAADNSVSAMALAALAAAFKFAVSGVLIVSIETVLAKMRLFRVPEFLSGAFLIGTLGMLSYYILE